MPKSNALAESWRSYTLRTSSSRTLGPHSHAAAALKGMPNEHSVKKHVEVLGYYLGDKAHDHPNCRYLGLSRPDWPTVLSVVLRAGAKKPPTRGHLLLPAPFKCLFLEVGTRPSNSADPPLTFDRFCSLDTDPTSLSSLFLGSSMLWLDGVSLGTEMTPLFRTSNTW